MLTVTRKEMLQWSKHNTVYRSGGTEGALGAFLKQEKMLFS
jgi:hypothetical protein